MEKLVARIVRLSYVLCFLIYLPTMILMALGNEAGSSRIRIAQLSDNEVKVSSPLAEQPEALAATTRRSSPSPLADRLYDKAEDIFQNATDVHYMHVKEEAGDQVQESNTGYQCETDCSGFVSYVINAVAPKHYAHVSKLTQSSHPHAGLYARFLIGLPDGVPTGGWLRVGNFRDLKRGDIIAWERPPRESEINTNLKGTGNRTGHVMIVVDPPGDIRTENIAEQPVRFVEVKVLDSSGVKHFPPESLPPQAHQETRDGLGKGFVRLILGEHDNVIGYWEGVYSETKRKPIVRPTYTSVIGFGRLLGFSSLK